MVTRKRARDVVTVASRKDDIDPLAETKTLKSNGLGARMHELRQAKDLTLEKLRETINPLLEKIGEKPIAGHPTLSNWEQERAEPRNINVLRALAAALDTTPQYLAYGVDTKPITVMPEPEVMGFTIVPELDFRDGLESPREVQRWGLPFNWLHSELHCLNVSNLIIYKIEVDSKGFEYGDRIVIDRAITKPSPPGDFLIWDGLGVMVTHVSVVPGSDKTLTARVTGVTGTYDIPVNKLHIIGRVRGLWKKV